MASTRHRVSRLRQLKVKTKIAKACGTSRVVAEIMQGLWIGFGSCLLRSESKGYELRFGSRITLWLYTRKSEFGRVWDLQEVSS